MASLLSTDVRIASRITALFLPILIAPIAFVGFASWFAAQDGITAVARDFLAFKAEQLLLFSSTQHALLEENGLSDQDVFREAAIASIADFASRLDDEEGAWVFALDGDGSVAFSTDGEGGTEAAATVAPTADEVASLVGGEGWTRFEAGEAERVAFLVPFEPFDWTMAVTQEADAFFAPARRITRQGIYAAAISVAVMLVVIGFVSGLITRPLNATVAAMNGVIADGDLKRQVKAPLNDETGQLAGAFNYMVRSLDQAYDEIKQFARKAAFSERRESKIRTVFQRYVPNHVIEQFFESPESMLIGEERELSVLFSDIRGFTTFSEGLTPREVVESLNEYFGRMVEPIIDNAGIVDKYIGDAIMAFFGAPEVTSLTPRNAVAAAFGMQQRLAEFNQWQAEHGKKPFYIGIAINHGKVTVGNIGSQQKMDYTVIGDMVNLVSRLEGLTKVYREELLITQSVRNAIKDEFPTRMVDRVQVKGRGGAASIWTARPEVTEAEARGFKHYHAGLIHYYKREFDAAAKRIAAAAELLPGDYLCELFLGRIAEVKTQDLPPDWKGIVKFDTK